MKQTNIEYFTLFYFVYKAFTMEYKYTEVLEYLGMTDPALINGTTIYWFAELRIKSFKIS